MTYLALLALAGSFLMTCQTGKALADPPPLLDLEIEAPATVRWEIMNISPGDSGLEPVTLRNTGNASGYLCLWVSDLIDGEGTNPESETGDTAEPGELSSYLYLDIVNEGMTFVKLVGSRHRDAGLPIRLNKFPGDIDHALCISSDPLEAGQALELQWQWTLSPETPNDAQGDNVTFSINYTLISSIPPGLSVSGDGGGMTSPAKLKDEESSDNATEESSPVTESPVEQVPSDSDNQTAQTETLFGARTFTSDDGRCVIFIPAGVRVSTLSGGELLDIRIDTCPTNPSVPESSKLASPVYRFRCFTSGAVTEGTQLDTSVHLTIYFDARDIPPDAEISIYSYRTGSGWVKQHAYGGVARGWLSTDIDYLDMAALIISCEEDIETIVLPIEPTIQAMPPYIGVISEGNLILKNISLGVALSGTAAMVVLAYIQRRRRNRQVANRYDNGDQANSSTI